MAFFPFAVLVLQVFFNIGGTSLVLPRDTMTIRVPYGTSRFNIPWRSPPRPKLPTLRESRGRVLYSGVREAVSDGLGHGMATTNAEVSTAMRLGVTYTHRVAKYGSLVGRSFGHEVLSQNRSSHKKKYTVAGLSARAGRIEGFFGWGVGEIPREAVQDAACDFRNGHPPIESCKLCTNADLESLKREGKGEKQSGLRIDQVVEIPMSLSYKFPHRPTAASNKSLAEFLKKHDKPYTAFHMPHEVCAKSPAYSKFFPTSRAYFFHKYWDAHARYPPRDPRGSLHVIPSMKLYRDSWGATLRIPSVPARGHLPRLHEHELTIAIHARRGDFFKVRRPMVSTKVFAQVVRKLVSEITKQKGTFAKMPVAVHIYSEGRPKLGLGEGVGHDVRRLTQDYYDADGKVLDVKTVTSIFRDADLDDLGRVFPNGLKVMLHVSQDTVTSLHEMIAADVFIGSMSGMSLHLVGTLSRGAMQILPTRMEQPDEWQGQVQFNAKDGNFSPVEWELVRSYWKEFASANEASARRAYERWLSSKML